MKEPSQSEQGQWPFQETAWTSDSKFGALFLKHKYGMEHSLSRIWLPQTKAVEVKNCS